MNISPELCLRCGACCSVEIDGEMVACRHLRIEEGLYKCSIYTTRPQVCRDYSCLRDGVPNPAVAERVLEAVDYLTKKGYLNDQEYQDPR